jgi:hypothetical protein
MIVFWFSVFFCLLKSKNHRKPLKNSQPLACSLLMNWTVDALGHFWTFPGRSTCTEPCGSGERHLKKCVCTAELATVIGDLSAAISLEVYSTVLYSMRGTSQERGC